MNTEPPSAEPAPRPAGGTWEFATTHWSVVLCAGDSQAAQSGEALDQVCAAYWYPLYGFVRGSGYGPDEAQDLTQEFFARLLEKGWLGEADPGRGRFRTFLLAALKHFLANEWHRAKRLKRGGGREMVALDALEAEARLALEPRDTATPEALYQRRWTTALIGRAQDRLRAEMLTAGQLERFEALEPTLVGDRATDGYEALAARFGVTETAVKSMVLRLRQRFRALVRDEVAETLLEGEDLEIELRELMAALGN